MTHKINHELSSQQIANYTSKQLAKAMDKVYALKKVHAYAINAKGYLTKYGNKHYSSEQDVKNKINHLTKKHRIHRCNRGKELTSHQVLDIADKHLSSLNHTFNDPLFNAKMSPSQITHKKDQINAYKAVKNDAIDAIKIQSPKVNRHFTHSKDLQGSVKSLTNLAKLRREIKRQRGSLTHENGFGNKHTSVKSEKINPMPTSSNEARRLQFKRQQGLHR